MDGINLPLMPKLHATPAEAGNIPTDPGRATALVLAHGTMELRWFSPREHDPQTPHDRDELYVVVSGTGIFKRARESKPMDDEAALPLLGEDRVRFGPGDALFVPAGTVHCFEDFSDDFACWIVFYGSEGGEANASCHHHALASGGPPPLG